MPNAMAMEHKTAIRRLSCLLNYAGHVFFCETEAGQGMMRCL